jgi:hypothetical protein
MIEPVTATTVLLVWVDRVCDRSMRGRQRDRLMVLAPLLPPGSEVEERYGHGAGWQIRLPATSRSGCEDDR